MVGAGRPSMACSAELAKFVDGRPAPTMTAWSNGASTAALVLRQVLSSGYRYVGLEILGNATISGWPARIAPRSTPVYPVNLEARGRELSASVALVKSRRSLEGSRNNSRSRTQATRRCRLFAVFMEKTRRRSVAPLGVGAVWLAGPSAPSEAGLDLQSEQKGLLAHIQPCVRIGVNLDADHLPVVVDQQRKF